MPATSFDSQIGAARSIPHDHLHTEPGQPARSHIFYDELDMERILQNVGQNVPTVLNRPAPIKVDAELLCFRPEG